MSIDIQGWSVMRCQQCSQHCPVYYTGAAPARIRCRQITPNKKAPGDQAFEEQRRVMLHPAASKSPALVKCSICAGIYTRFGITRHLGQKHQKTAFDLLTPEQYFIPYLPSQDDAELNGLYGDGHP